MIKFFYGFLLFLPLITTAQTIDQALSNSYFYQAATVSSILFVCSEKYPEYRKQFRTSSLMGLVTSGDIEVVKNIGIELLSDKEFITDVQQVLDDKSGIVFCTRMSHTLMTKIH
ncbi:TPA: hypothetical protein ACX6PM_000652 [Photobacterium damselae]